MNSGAVRFQWPVRILVISFGANAIVVCCRKMMMMRILPLLIVLLVLMVAFPQFIKAETSIVEDAASAAATAWQNIEEWRSTIDQLRGLQHGFETYPRKMDGLLPLQSVPAEAESQVASQVRAQQRSQLLVFLTLSMPDASLKEWVAATHDASGTAMIRGFHQNKLSSTIHQISEIHSDDELQGGFQVDPSTFRHFGITAAPTVIILADPLPPCKSQGCVDDRIPQFDIIRGNTTLDYAIQRLATEGNAAHMAGQYLSALRGVEK